MPTTIDIIDIICDNEFKLALLAGQEPFIKPPFAYFPNTASTSPSLLDERCRYSYIEGYHDCLAHF
ncbi:MAG: hypothetical protein KJ727_03525, partial [Acidobacteria bacterium]|nr:hypothetical protein [Acidobacteriota bacterium]